MLKVITSALLCVGMVHSEMYSFDRTMSSVPEGWSKNEEAGPEEMLNFRIYLKQENLDVLERKFWETSDPSHAEYQKFMSIQEITDIVAPSSEAVSTVYDWMKAHKVQEIDIENQGDVLKVNTTVKIASEMFATTFHWFVHTPTGKKILSHFGGMKVPETPSKYIDLVWGLSYFPLGKSGRLGDTARKESLQGGKYFVVAQSWQAMYGLPASFKSAVSPSVHTGQNVVQFDGQTYDKEGMGGYSQNISPLVLPTDATTVGKEVDRFAGEAQLDIEAQAAIASNITQWFWLNPAGSWMLSFASDFFAKQTVPWVNSISYAWSEYDQCSETAGRDCQTFGVNNDQLVNRTNIEFQKIGLRGVSLFVASGDSGAHGRTDQGCNKPHFTPDFPACSPYVTSVGATYRENPTYLAASTLPCDPYCVSGGEEVAVSYKANRYVAGGGFSHLSPMPDYQKAAVNAYLTSGVELPQKTTYNASNRAFPDVSMDGFSILVYSSGTVFTGESGTSASAPSFSAVASLLVDHSLSTTQKPLGFMNPLLYQMNAAHPNTFNDITIGDNNCTEGGCGLFHKCEGFVATKGWDAVTGLGSPNYPAMLKALDGMLKKREREGEGLKGEEEGSAMMMA